MQDDWKARPESDVEPGPSHRDYGSFQRQCLSHRELRSSTRQQRSVSFCLRKMREQVERDRAHRVGQQHDLQEQLSQRAGDRASALHGMFSAATTRRYAVATASITCVKTWGRSTNCHFRLPSFRSRGCPTAPDVSVHSFRSLTPRRLTMGQTSTLFLRRGFLIPILPCLGALLDFPGNGTNRFPDYGCANGSAGLVPSNSYSC